MQKFLGGSRFLMVIGFAEVLLGLPNVVAAAPD
jgi:hypothetical protein